MHVLGLVFAMSLAIANAPPQALPVPPAAPGLGDVTVTCLPPDVPPLSELVVRDQRVRAWQQTDNQSILALGVLFHHAATDRLYAFWWVGDPSSRVLATVDDDPLQPTQRWWYDAGVVTATGHALRVTRTQTCQWHRATPEAAHVVTPP